MQQYVYWSERRVVRWLEDQGIQPNQKKQRKLGTPSLGGKLPSAEWTREQSGLPPRPVLAKLLEDKWGALVVSDFDALGPISWAKGRGYIELNDFVVRPREQAVMYAEKTTKEGKVVGICLFGSTENYAEFVTDAGTLSTQGWTSSAAKGVQQFLQDRSMKSGYPDTVEEIVIEALKIAKTQGVNGPKNREEAWCRAHSYGDVLDGEWFAEIYLDYSMEDLGELGEFGQGCDRVLVGAPLWVRTPSLRAIRLYNEYDQAELEAESNNDRLRVRLARWLLRGA